MTMGGAIPAVTDGGGPVTVTVPFEAGFSPSW